MLLSSVDTRRLNRLKSEMICSNYHSKPLENPEVGNQEFLPLQFKLKMQSNGQPGSLLNTQSGECLEAASSYGRCLQAVKPTCYRAHVWGHSPCGRDEWLCACCPGAQIPRAHSALHWCMILKGRKNQKLKLRHGQHSNIRNLTVA